MKKRIISSAAAGAMALTMLPTLPDIFLNTPQLPTLPRCADSAPATRARTRARRPMTAGRK